MQGFTVWFTGLSGSGKSTLSAALLSAFAARGISKVEVLDGDAVRTHLSKGLTFSREDRDVNVRRIGFVCDLLARNEVIAVAAAISPYRAVRADVRAMHEDNNFLEVYLKVDVDVVAERDVKGLYKKAFAGEIPNFTGVSDPYEAPEAPEVMVDTGGGNTVDVGVAKILRAAELLGYLQPAPQGLEALTADVEKEIVETLRQAGRTVVGAA